MTRDRARRLAVLGALTLLKGCGDGGPTTPPTPEPSRATTVVVSPAAAELTALGATVQLAAEVRDQHAQVMAGVTVTWSTEDMSVATVDASGLVTAVAPGSATITATTGRVSGSTEVTVTQTVVSIRISPPADTISVGDTLQLSAEGFDGNGVAVEDAEFAWESSDTSVATVDASGLVTGVAVGVATITASAGSGEATAEITVADPQRAALEALYTATDGPKWTRADNWLTDAPLGEWHGLDTDASGRVVEVDLSGNGLAGPIRPEIGNLTGLGRLDLQNNGLTGPIPPEIGNLESLRLFYLTGNGLTGPIPPEIGRLTELIGISLRSNDLSGPIPPEFGNLANLVWLRLSNNGLTGPFPESMLRIERLKILTFEGNPDLCAPGTSAFVTWLGDIVDRLEGPYCNESDVAVLEAAYQAWDGPGWSSADGWLTTSALEEWYGVTADSLGHVVSLDLAGNGLEGRLPARLGTLRSLTVLRVGDNALTGRLPLSLANLDLAEFRYAGTGLCVPASASFRSWLAGIASHEGTGAECGPVSAREALQALYHATDGRNWRRSDNWLTDAPLGEWYGVTADGSGRVVALDMQVNGLTGRIPPELGSLASLTDIFLGGNELSGPIPPELGNLASLVQLTLNGNGLTGPIPPELGDLARLRHLQLWGNELSGRIPAGLGSLADLRSLYLGNNGLSGPIPPELGSLARLEVLRLERNGLSGVIPPELGGLGSLFLLYLNDNGLTGPVPPEFGRLSNLARLDVANNAGLSGPLPATLTALSRLERLMAGGTGLCAPEDPGFQAWLEGVVRRRVARCVTGDPPMAYLTQAVQSLDHPVPLVAGEKALLRAFVTAGASTADGIPPVRARFYLDGLETYVAEIRATSTPPPSDPADNGLPESANAEIPGDIVQPGLEMVIEVDPDGTVVPGPAVPMRIPEAGRIAVDVREMPVLDLTVIPFLWTADPDREVVEMAAGMAEDPDGHELLWATRTLLPIRDLEVTAHEPVLTSSNNAFDLLAETIAIRAMEGGRSYYMGMMSGPVTGAGGVAPGGPSRTNFSIPHPETIAHELGHNLSLDHAPCGPTSAVDPSFPYPDGSTGAWGYDFRDGGRPLSPHRTYDLMSYCRPRWISDYHFTNALRFRLLDARPTLLASRSAQEAESLLLWGGTDRDSKPFLNPAFVVDAPPTLPGAGGEHRITGRTGSGNELFALDFTMPEVADGDGSSSFAFVLPVEPGWADNLASIELSGPGGPARLDGDTDLAISIVLDPGTGQVRAILRDAPQADMAAALAPQAGGESLDTLFSRGIPDAAAWDR